ncbi:hypothetical protein FHR92_000574 [Fontibacillus solani]|uniref:Uncharacterized protein n=1 Tax=Fontibacillus solani TaxID=1572857 RepID=A0A7W3SQ06_9BACL|nr:hypothetical protein [Fontibacillus solani]MBA9084120.1 hypothetical protein [Fontibacillus solani]
MRSCYFGCEFYFICGNISTSRIDGEFKSLRPAHELRRYPALQTGNADRAGR